MMKTMRKRNILHNSLIKAMVLVLPFLALSSCKQDREVENPSPDTDLLAFEKAYSKSLHDGASETITLIGFKKIKIEKDTFVLNSRIYVKMISYI